MGNPSGGQSQGLTYSGTLQEPAINWDLDTLLRLPGLLFNVGAAWSTGTNLSADAIGNSFTVQSAYTAPGDGTNNLTLGEMYVQQQLLHHSLLIAAGRLVPETTFATMPVLNQYVNAGINPAPGALGINDATFTGYPPGVEWGVQAMYNLTPRWRIAAGVFNTNQSAAGGGKGGLDFALQQGNRGVLSVVQVTYLANHAPGESGLPGQFTLGGFYDSNRLSSLKLQPAQRHGERYLWLLWPVAADGVPCRWGEQPARVDRLGRGGLRAESACQPHALFRGRWRELSGEPRAWPRQRHCVSGVHCRDVQPLHPPDHGRDGAGGGGPGHRHALALRHA